MTDDELLKIKVMEEANEISQRMAKVIWFGMDQRQPGLPYYEDNRTRLLRELHDLLAVLEMLHLIDLNNPHWVNDEWIQEKQHKVRNYLDFAQGRGPHP